SVKEWRAPKRKGGGKGSDKSNKKPKGAGFTTKETNLDMEERMAVVTRNVGNDGFKEDLAKAMKDYKYSIQAWYEGVSEASAPNMFVEVSYGLYFIAAGLQGLAPEEMSSLGWSQLEKGDIENGKKQVVRETYAAHCEAKHKPVDYKSDDFKTFVAQIKDYNSGFNRFLLAYKKLGSVLLLCPQLISAHRFLSPHLGPKLKEAIIGMDFPQGERQSREHVHNAILMKVVAIPGDERQDLAGALKDIDQTIAQPQTHMSKMHPRSRNGAPINTTNH
ncbi:hypothetical protein FRC11_010978, partial [Ceratobasidium sp. 423]